MIITFANRKGGVGKTSLAVILAQSAVENGMPVKMIDLDEQGSFTKIMSAWAETHESDIEISNKLSEAQKSREALVIIDTPPALGKQTEDAIKIADRVIIPVDTSTEAMTGIGYLLNKNDNLIIAINRFVARSGFDQNVFSLLTNEFVVKRMNNNPIPVITLPENRFVRVNMSRNKTWNENMARESQTQFVDFMKAVLGGNN